MTPHFNMIPCSTTSRLTLEVPNSGPSDTLHPEGDRDSWGSDTVHTELFLAHCARESYNHAKFNVGSCTVPGYCSGFDLMRVLFLSILSLQIAVFV
jgi:hypothetical protein